MPSTAAQDLLNVDITPGGKSVKKREGFGLDVTLNSATSTAHNLYTFYDTSGNQVRLAFNDRNVNSSVNGAAWTVVLTTGITVGATWDCTDYLGQAYCVSTAFDCPIITNGTSAGTSCNASIPAGTCVASTGDRLLVGGTSANPSRISFSQSTVFTNFTLGTQNSSPSFEDIFAPGSKITHLAYHYGRWLWWKDQSFGYMIGTGQLDLQIITVSNTIGTLDNTDVFDQGLTYFRGTDNQIYIYDGSNLTRTFSTDIAPTLRTANRRKANSWAQTTASDWASGAFLPAVNFSTSTSPGDIVLVSSTVIDTSQADFLLGTSTNMTVESGGDLIISTNSTSMNNGSFEKGDFTNWTTNNVGGRGGTVVSTLAGTGGSCNVSTAQDGTYFSYLTVSTVLNFSIWDASTNVGLSTTAVTAAASPGNCTWTAQTLTVSSFTRRKVKLVISIDDSPTSTITSDPFILNGGNITFYTASPRECSLGLCASVTFDNFSGGFVSSLSTATFQSRVFDTGMTSTTVSGQASWTANEFTPYFELQTASNSTTGPWKQIVTSSGTSATSNRYIRYVSSFTAGTNDDVLTTLNDASIVAVSTGGIFYSAVNNAPLLTSFNEFNATDNTAGGTIVYYTRTSTNAFTVSSSTPAWVAQTKNGTVAASTGTYMQARTDFASNSSAKTLSLSDFQFNWFEGNAADKMYGTYFNNAIWFSLSLGTSTTNNNRIVRYDLLSQAWTLYDIQANGFLTYNNFLYFGGASTGAVFQYGNGVTSDNGVAINSYWKSKDFFGASPFQDEDLRTSSWYIKSSSGTTLTMNYEVNESTTTSYSINLFDSKASIIRHNRNFLAGSMYNTINWKFGDNSSNPAWEVFAGQWTYVPRSWSVYP